MRQLRRGLRSLLRRRVRGLLVRSDAAARCGAVARGFVSTAAASLDLRVADGARLFDRDGERGAAAVAPDPDGDRDELVERVDADAELDADDAEDAECMEGMDREW